MMVLLFLCLSSLLLSGSPEAVSRRRRQQPVNISTPVWNGTNSIDKTDTTVNMSDYEDNSDASNNDSMPLMPLDIELPDLNSVDKNATGSSCGFSFCNLVQLCSSDASCVTSDPPECRSSCWKNGVEVTEPPPLTDKTDTTMNMSDYDDNSDASNSDSMPLMPLDVDLPDLNFVDKNATGSSCGFNYCDLEPCSSDAVCMTSDPPECRSSCWKDGVEVTQHPPTTDKTDTTVNMSDYDDNSDASNSDSMPLMPLDIDLPDLNFVDKNATGSSCGFNYCDLEPCSSDAVCMTSDPPECRSSCWKDGVEVTQHPPTTATHPPDNSEGLHKNSKTCPGFTALSCQNGVVGDCTEGFSCVCDAGYSGILCAEVCALPCVHGDCDVGDNGDAFCSCEHTHRGKLCDELIPDPEQRARILAAVLSTAIAVAVILIIVIPVIMWRLRVILILKFIYMFKQYEDEDGKEFDAYVSMTSTANTESFVYGSLQPMLENHNFKLFLQARDGPAGDVMSEAILSALEKSRRTIMIITPDYITNEWSRFEYLIAQHETLKLQQRIIPIILEDVDKENVNMDKSLKHILNSIKCLKYPNAKLESITSNGEENIQSPDSNISVNSTTAFYKSDRSSSTDSVTKEEQKSERKAAKFWKRLVLSMPKKKSQKNSSRSFLPTLKKETKYEINPLNFEDKPRYNGCSNPAISGFNFTINVINDINNDAFLHKI